MKYERAEILFQKYLSGEITSSELDELDALLQDEQAVQDFRAYISLNRKIMKDAEDESSSSLKDFALPKKKKQSGYSYLRYAAVLVILLGVGFLLTFLNRSSVGPEPSTDKITLKISDSITKNIGNEDNLVLNLGNVNIIQKGDTLKYVSKGKVTTLSYNEIKVPNGEKVVLQLSDDSFVTLNSGSTLKYPIDFFQEGRREVFLTGEAYFQVTSDKSRPFIVTADDLEISVLGTEFNVKAYKGAGVIQTVLVEGSVGMKSIDSTQSMVILEPNMLGNYRKDNGEILTQKVDPASYISWLQGKLVFEKEEFSSIARTLERQFDVKIEIRDDTLAKEKFTARIEGNNLEDILNYFKVSYPFTYTKSGSKYIIEPEPKK